MSLTTVCLRKFKGCIFAEELRAIVLVQLHAETLMSKEVARVVYRFERHLGAVCEALNNYKHKILVVVIVVSVQEASKILVAHSMIRVIE